MRVRLGVCAIAIVASLACSDDPDDPDGGGATGGSAGSTGGSGGATGGSAGATGGSAGATGGSAGATGGSAGSSGSSGTSGRWQPKPGTSWQWQLTGTIDTTIDVAMYDIDLFEAPQAVIDELHAKGRTVICYFSAGSREDWRPDAGAFQAADYGNPLDGWPGEHWLDVRSDNVRTIMKQRLDLAVGKGCDGVEPDNVDGYSNDSGFSLTKNDQIDFNRFLATESKQRGLSVGLKNALELIGDLEVDFDWALNEECVSYSECSLLSPFLAAQKAVFHVEYVDQSSQGAGKQAAVCSDPTVAGFSTLIKTWDLDAWRLSCP